MKKKFIVLTLCFTILFTSINYKKSYANPLIAFTPQIIATIATIAVGAGITLSTDDDIRDIARIFYERNKSHWENVENVFKIAVTIGTNGIVNVGKEFLDLCKSTFDSTFNNDYSSSSSVIGAKAGLPLYSYSTTSIPSVMFGSSYDISSFTNYQDEFKIGDLTFIYLGTKFISPTTYNRYFINTSNNISVVNNEFLIPSNSKLEDVRFFVNDVPGMSLDIITAKYKNYKNVIEGTEIARVTNWYAHGGYALPYQPGSYDWDKVNENANENGDVGLYVPGNAGSLVGQQGGTIAKPGELNPPYDLPLAGDVTIPNVSNPSLDIADSVPFPGVIEGNPDIPGTGNPDIPGGVPPFPSFGDSIDFSPMYMTNINEKFPFSLPWDIGRLLGTLNAPEKAPIFKVPVPYTQEGFTIDFTMFEELASLIRFFALFGFIITLILLSTKLLG